MTPRPRLLLTAALALPLLTAALAAGPAPASACPACAEPSQARITRTLSTLGVSDDPDDPDALPLVPPGDDFVQVVARDGTCFALRRGGEVVSWDEYGMDEEVIVETLHDGPFMNGRFSSLVASDDGICGYTRSHLNICWGSIWFDGRDRVSTWGVQAQGIAEDGILGIDEAGALRCLGSEYFCARVLSSGTWQAVRCADSNRCCALRTDGEVRCWSDDAYIASARGPFTSLTMLGQRMCALRADGALSCWSVSEEDVVVTPRGLFSQVTLDISNQSTCGVQGNGEVLCWGEDGRSTPLTEGGAPVSARQIVLNGNRLCALRGDGTLHGPITDIGDITSPHDERPLSADMPWLDQIKDCTPSGCALAPLIAAAMDGDRDTPTLHLGSHTPQGLRDPAPVTPPRERDLTLVTGAPSAWALNIVSGSGQKPTWEALDLLTQRARWRVPAPTPGAPRCVLQSADTVIAVTMEGAFALDAKSGARRWALAHQLGLLDPYALCGHQLAPGHDAGLLLLITEEEDIAAALQREPDSEHDAQTSFVLQRLDPHTGKPRWTALAPAEVPLSAYDRRALWLTSQVALLVRRGDDETPSTVFAWSAADGALRWVYTAPSTHRIEAAALAGELVWISRVPVDGDGEVIRDGIIPHTLEALRLSDGAPAPDVAPYTLEAPAGDVLSLHVVADALAVFTPGDGMLRAIHASTGQHLWAWGVGAQTHTVQALTGAEGAWLIAHTDDIGAFVFDLRRPPPSVEVVVEGYLSRWASLVIAGQRVIPSNRDHFRATVSVGGRVNAYGYFNDCAHGEAGSFSRDFTIWPDTGHVWMSADDWDYESPNCP